MEQAPQPAKRKANKANDDDVVKTEAETARPSKASKIAANASAGVGSLVDSTKKLLETFKQEHSLSDLLAEKDKQYEELRAKFQKMKEQQEKEHANSLDESKRDAKEREKASGDMIAHLKREVERLKKRLDGSEEIARKEQEVKDTEKLRKDNDFLKSQTIALIDKAIVAIKKLE